MIERGATHIGVATDHVVESFRNDRYPGYKTTEGVPQKLLSQFPILEEALEAIGVMVWPMVHYEADDALASAAGKASQDDSVKQVIICTPDKDLSQYAGARRTGAAIYYLLEPGTFSEMHRLKGDEVSFLCGRCGGDVAVEGGWTGGDGGDWE